MKKVFISFKMKSLDAKVDFDVEGEYKNNRLKFVDPDKSLNYIIFNEKYIEYYKKGDMDMKFKFKLDKMTNGVYKVMGNEFKFAIKTYYLKNQADHLQIKYKLYQQEDLVNEQDLSVKYHFLEEE